MTQLKLVKGLLTSRGIREKVGNIKGKIRYLDVKHPIVRQGESKNLLDRIGDGFNALKGFVSGNGWWARLFQNGASAIFNWLKTSAIKLATFDFNQSDKQLLEIIKGEANRLASALGTVAGQLIGWTVSIAVGYGVSLVVPVIGGAALARTVTQLAKAEAISDISSGIGAALLQTIGAVGTTALVGGYFLARRALNRGKEWESSGAVYSLSAGVEYLLNKIPFSFVRTFLESALDSATDSFWEGGTIIAYELDNAYEQAKRAQENTRGKKRTVKITPDKRRKTEQLVLSGTQADLEEEVITTLNNYRLIANRDVGQIVGMPADDFLSAKPMRRQLTIVFKTKKEPPWVMPDGKKAKEYVVTVPDADLGLTWSKIKLAAKSYTWGKFRATAHLDNGRQMVVYGASKNEAEKTLRRMVELSTAKILALNVTEEVEKKNINLKKEPKTVYPAYATLLVRRPTTGEGRNFADNTKLAEERIRIDLWTTEAPKGLQPLQ